MTPLFRQMMLTTKFVTLCSQYRSTRHFSKSLKWMADHLSITADQTRQNVLAPAIVTEIKNISETVKLLKVEVKEESFLFKAGQWVDMFIPGVQTVGGFSMCSAPDLLNSSRTLHLAIKFAQHPPAHWVHTKCQVGDSVMVQAGGDVFYDPKVSDTPSDLVLFAGGVGINPLFSILQHFAFLSSQNSEQTKNRKAILTYSAKTVDDLIFMKDLMKMRKEYRDIIVKLRCTGQSKNIPTGVTASRIDQSLVRKVVSPLDKSRTDVYICGPSSFIDDIGSYCLSCHVQKQKIHYERWW